MKYLGTVLFTILIGCGKEESKSSASDVKVTSLDQIHGTWALESASLKNSPGESSTINGSQKYAFRKNGTFFRYAKAFTLSFAGESVIDKCTGASSGNIEIEGDQAILSNIATGYIGGNCGEGEPANTIKKNEDTSFSVVLSGDYLDVSSDFTFVDEKGVSKKDSAVSRFKKEAEAEWDGGGLDPAYTGEWTLKKALDTYLCTPKPAPEAGDKPALRMLAEPTFSGEFTISGSLVLKVSDSTYEAKQTNFSIEGGEECTGTENGKVTGTEFTFETKPESSSDECASQAPKTKGTVEYVYRDIVLGDAMINLLYDSVPDETCTEGKIESQLIMIHQKSK
jgi:hypothetical protein